MTWQKKAVSPELLTRLRAAKADGWPTKEIIETFGVSRHQVFDLVGGGGMTNAECASFNYSRRRIVAECKHADLRGL